MKKAKLALTAIAVFAVVGGALAIKAQKFQDDTLFAPTGTTTINSVTFPLCPLEPNVAVRATAPVSTFYTTLSAIGTVTNICAVTTTTHATLIPE